MKILHDAGEKETRELLRAIDKRQQDLSTSIETALGGDSRTDSTHTSHPLPGKRKQKKKRAGKLEKIKKAMNDPQWSYFRVRQLVSLPLEIF